jgi:hypothetical protein
MHAFCLWRRLLFPFLPPTTKLEATLTLTHTTGALQNFKKIQKWLFPNSGVGEDIFFFYLFCFAVLLHFDPNILSPISVSSSEREGGAVNVSKLCFGLQVKMKNVIVALLQQILKGCSIFCH